MAIIVPKEFKPLASYYNEPKFPHRPEDIKEGRREFAESARQGAILQDVDALEGWKDKQVLLGNDTRPSRAKLMRAMENIDFAKTQADQDTIAYEIGKSTERAISPELISVLEERYGLQRRAETLPERVRAPAPATPMAGPTPEEVEQNRVPLSRLKASSVPGGRYQLLPEETATPVFPEQADFDKISKEVEAVAVPYKKGVSPISEITPFQSAPWKGDTEPEHVPAPLKLGMQIKEGVNVEELRPEMDEGIQQIADIYKAAGVSTEDMVLTDAVTKRGKRKTFHDIGLGADFRWKGLDDDQKERIKAGLKDAADSVSASGTYTIGPYEVLIHKEAGDEYHLHIEYEKAKPELNLYWERLRAGKQPGGKL